jgi:hypothetical protein
VSLCSLSQTPNSDCIITWSSTLRLSADTIPSYIPKIVRGNSTFHVLWYGNDLGAGGGIQYCRSTNAGITFSPQQTLVAYDISLGVGGYLAAADNNVYVAFLATSDSLPFYGIGFLRSTNSGQIWETTRILRSGGLPNLIAAHDSFVYIQYQSSINRTALLRSSDAGETWTEFATGQPQLRAIVPDQTRLHGVTVVGAPTPEVVYYRSSNNAQSWFGAEYLSREDAVHSILPALALSDGGNPVIVWNDSGAIYFRRSQDEGSRWLPEAQISEKKGAVFPDIGASGEYIAMAWDNEPASGGKVYLRGSNRYGITFCPIDSPATNPTASEPSLTLENNIIHLVWTEMVGTTTEIFYRQGYLPPDPLSLPPTEVALYQNYPNPFNSVTHITYDVPVDGLVRLTVYNVLGEKIANLVNDIQKAKRRYSVSFDGSDLPSGVYFYRLRTASTTQTRKFLLLK